MRGIAGMRISMVIESEAGEISAVTTVILRQSILPMRRYEQLPSIRRIEKGVNSLLSNSHLAAGQRNLRSADHSV